MIMWTTYPAENAETLQAIRSLCGASRKTTLGNRSGANTLPFLVPHGEAQIAATISQSISGMTRWRIAKRLRMGLPCNLLRVEFRRYLIATG
jgi:hypothetical protein